MKKLLLLLFSIMISLESFGHRYWKYENNYSPNHHPRVSRIYLIEENGDYVDFSGASFTSDNCSDIGTVPSMGDSYTIDLGSSNNVQGFGFFNTYEEGSRTTVAKLYYSDDNLSWTSVDQFQITTDNGCGEYNRAINPNINPSQKVYCLGESLQVINNLIYSKDITVKPFTGSNTCKYENGQIHSKGNIVSGKRDGNWSIWNSNGLKQLELNYKAGELYIRTEFEYYENNQMESVKSYKENRLNGKLIIWHENGQMKLEEHYKAGNRDGKRTTWYENGQMKQEEHYKAGNRDGKRTTWYENGQMKQEEYYRAGNKNGKWSKWKSNGLKQSELKYEGGELNIRTEFKYYDNNQIESVISYKNNRLNGRSVFYWDNNGQKFIDGSYKDDKPDGKWIVWSKNGQKKEELNYKNGDLVDRTIFKYSFLTGNLKSEKKYKDGSCVSGC